MDFYLKEFLGVDYQLTHDKEQFAEHKEEKFSYTFAPMGEELFFSSDELLFEKSIVEKKISYVSYQDINCIFPVYNKKSVLPFDLFAAGFYLLSRYEEYLPFVRDEHGRFEAQSSIAYRLGFLQKPVVDIFAYWLKESLQKEFPAMKFKKRKFNFIPSFDIDSAFAYKGKGLIRNIGGLIKSLVWFNHKEILNRLKVWTASEKDPFDTFDYIREIHQQYGFKPIYFVLFADYGLNDKNIPIDNRCFRSIIKTLGDYGEVGIHPSYTSNTVEGKLKHEISNLSHVLKREIKKSRQHFLILSFPKTYRKLIKLDVEQDYSMGYASQVGFRASTSTPYCFFDLELHTATRLQIFPFSYMEGALKDYKKVEAEDAMNHILPLIEEVKKVEGTFISLWHNESVNNKNRWIGWKKVYEEMVKKIKDLQEN